MRLRWHFELVGLPKITNEIKIKAYDLMDVVYTKNNGVNYSLICQCMLDAMVFFNHAVLLQSVCRSSLCLWSTWKSEVGSVWESSGSWFYSSTICCSVNTTTPGQTACSRYTASNVSKILNVSKVLDGTYIYESKRIQQPQKASASLFNNFNSTSTLSPIVLERSLLIQFHISLNGTCKEKLEGNRNRKFCFMY